VKVRVENVRTSEDGPGRDQAYPKGEKLTVALKSAKKLILFCWGEDSHKLRPKKRQSRDIREGLKRGDNRKSADLHQVTPANGGEKKGRLVEDGTPGNLENRPGQKEGPNLEAKKKQSAAPTVYGFVKGKKKRED